MIEQGPRLLGREDEDVSEAIRDIFDEDGITVLTDTGARSVSLANGRVVSLDLETPDGSLDLVATEPLENLFATLD